MLPAKHDTTRRSRTGLNLFALVVIVGQGCVHSPITNLVQQDSVPTELVSQSVSNQPPQRPGTFSRLAKWFGRDSKKTMRIDGQAEAQRDVNDVTVQVQTHNGMMKQGQGTSRKNASREPDNQPIPAASWSNVQLNAKPNAPERIPLRLPSESNPSYSTNSPVAVNPPATPASPRPRSIIAGSKPVDQVPSQQVTQASAQVFVNVIRETSPNTPPALAPKLESLPSARPVPNVAQILSPPASAPVRKHRHPNGVARPSQIAGTIPAVMSATSRPVAKGTTKVPRVTPASYEGAIQAVAQMPDGEEQSPVPDGEPNVAPERDLPRSSPPAPAPATQVDPLPSGPVRIPLVGEEPAKDIELTMKNGRVSLVTRNAPVQSILNLLAEQQGLNLIAADDVTANISVTLSNVAFEDALNAIVAIAGCTWTQNRGIVLVSKIGGTSQTGPDVQGKVVQVFPLNFIAAADIEATIKGLLSPMGQVFVSQASSADKRKTQELVVIEDIPSSVSRITQYIQQVDQAPRQVMIEAHVLQVDLKDDTRHGVDWKFITTYLGRDISLKSVGFANAAASPASIFSLDGGHLDLVVEALKTTSDAKTLASPQIIVANGQEARIQIGSKLGYFVTTTTQTSTLQNVNFLNTGVLLKVTPQISNDNRVLMVVSPEVSTGRISAAGLPETNTTEAMTTVLLENNGGMVIGGLIKESDSDTQDKVPLLGDLWLVGRLFQKRAIARQRSEIIIVLIPHITPYSPDGQMAEQTGILRATTPIFQNGLQPAPRPLDPRLPDAINNPRRLRANRLPDLLNNPQDENPKPLTYYFPTDDEEFLQPEHPYRSQPVVNEPQVLQFEPLPQPLPPVVNTLPVLEPPPSDSVLEKPGATAP